MSKRTKASARAKDTTQPPSQPTSDGSEENMKVYKILLPISELNLDIVLKCGQSFRWNKLSSSDWIGVMRERLWILTQTEDGISFRVQPDDKPESDHKEILEDYFHLKVELGPLYESWAKVDPVFNVISQRYSGIRILRQDPIENVFSFICSSNNNIQRISGMVENLCTHYGQKVCDFQGKSYFAFPKLESLAQGEVEAKLRTLGFGYRAGYISKTAQQLLDKGGESFLHGLRVVSYDEARKELLQCTGIGPKVADCILLMSLDKPAAIPVDTHMFQIAANQYLPHLKQYKSVTDKVYLEISKHFQNLYGGYAGWAHSVLFSADLRHLKNVGQTQEEEIPAKKKKIAKKSKK